MNYKKMKKKKIIKDNNAYINILVAILLLISTLSVLSALIFSTQLYEGSTLDPIVFTDRYQNMSYNELKIYMREKHGGHEWNENRFVWEWQFLQAWIVYPDGTEIRQSEWLTFMKGEGTPEEQDWQLTIWNIITLNIPLLNNLGIVGIAIKAIIALLVGLIIYLLLPFTG